MRTTCISGHAIDDDTALAATAIMPGFRIHHLCRECALLPVWRDHVVFLGSLPLMRLVPGPAWFVLPAPPTLDHLGTLKGTTPSRGALHASLRCGRSHP